jgi:glycosyltransferase involved in cell wall biosynthesis
MNYPKISIITVVLNAEKTIEKTILSVINQEYSNLEYIIIDGGSSDRTLETIAKYRSNIACLINEKDKGIYDAMNKGIHLSRGDYIHFLNAGDYFVNNKVLTGVTQLLKEKKLIACGDVVLQYPDGFKRVHKANLSLYDMPTYHQAMFFKNAVFQHYGKYNTYYTLSADFDIWQRVYLNQKDEVLSMDVPISINNLEGVSNRNYFRAILERMHISIYNLSGLQRVKSLLLTSGVLIRCLGVAFLRHMGIYMRVIRFKHRKRL